ncbi:MAG: efflux RND transporter periplasmic adaptor subunit [Gammaproteobacteria bacterium]|nr:efflux RND transporter periplasmic adaptor subunit [Gammaproteobacteria bacterium]
MRHNINPYFKSYWSYLVVGLFILALVWLLTDINYKPETIERLSPLYKVSAVEVLPVDARVKIKAIGVSAARWKTDVIASVNGRVVNLPEKTNPGDSLSNGELLAQLKNSLYQSEQKSALARVAQAELAVTRTKNEQLVAKKVNNGKSKTSFAKFKPHVKSAEADLHAAQASYAYALSQLQETRIKAPFDAVVLERNVTPGQWVNAGDRLFVISENKTIDINVGLSASAWKRLGTLSSRSKIKIIAPEGKEWIASLNYLSPIMDPTTGQRNVVLEVNQPYSSDKPLLSGQQVEVIFEGALQSNMVRAPASVLTEDGKVWTINNNLLMLEDIELLEEQAEFISFRYHKQPTKKRLLVRYPLSSMLEGQKVKSELVYFKLVINSNIDSIQSVSELKTEPVSVKNEVSL